MPAEQGGDNGPEHFGVLGPDGAWREQHPWSSQVNGVQLRGRKRDLGEGGIRQAGLIEWPKVVRGNGATEFPVRITDYLPTLLDIHGTVPAQPSCSRLISRQTISVELRLLVSSPHHCE